MHAADAPKAPEGHPREYLELLAKRDDWKELTRRLVLFIYRYERKASMHDAEDLAQTTFVRMLEPTTKRWNPVLQPDFFRYLCGVAVGVIWNWRRTEARSHERPYDHAGLAKIERKRRESSGSEETTETEYVARQHAAIAIARLELRIRGDEGCLEVLTLSRAGVEERDEQMKILGASLEYVKNARRRLTTHLVAVLGELEAEGGDHRV
jgi:hypothetical protein